MKVLSARTTAGGLQGQAFRGLPRGLVLLGFIFHEQRSHKAEATSWAGVRETGGGLVPVGPCLSAHIVPELTLMMGLRFREVKRRAQGHTASKQQKQDRNAEPFTPNTLP